MFVRSKRYPLYLHRIATPSILKAVTLIGASPTPTGPVTAASAHVGDHLFTGMPKGMFFNRVEEGDRHGIVVATAPCRVVWFENIRHEGKRLTAAQEGGWDDFTQGSVQAVHRVHYGVGIPQRLASSEWCVSVKGDQRQASDRAHQLLTGAHERQGLHPMYSALPPMFDYFPDVVPKFSAWVLRLWPKIFPTSPPPMRTGTPAPNTVVHIAPWWCADTCAAFCHTNVWRSWLAFRGKYADTLGHAAVDITLLYVGWRHALLYTLCMAPTFVALSVTSLPSLDCILLSAGVAGVLWASFPRIRAVQFIPMVTPIAGFLVLLFVTLLMWVAGLLKYIDERTNQLHLIVLAAFSVATAGLKAAGRRFGYGYFIAGITSGLLIPLHFEVTRLITWRYRDPVQGELWSKLQAAQKKLPQYQKTLRQAIDTAAKEEEEAKKVVDSILRGPQGEALQEVKTARAAIRTHRVQLMELTEKEEKRRVNTIICALPAVGVPIAFISGGNTPRDSEMAGKVGVLCAGLFLLRVIQHVIAANVDEFRKSMLRDNIQTLHADIDASKERAAEGARSLVDAAKAKSSSVIAKKEAVLHKLEGIIKEREGEFQAYLAQKDEREGRGAAWKEKDERRKKALRNYFTAGVVDIYGAWTQAWWSSSHSPARASKNVLREALQGKPDPELDNLDEVEE